MSKKYIGITVGPIFDTMLDASSPAAMWFTSFLFSDLTRRISEKISDAPELGKTEIYSPYYTPETDIYRDGVGKFHDRILFSIDTDNNSYETILQNLIKDVKAETAEYFTNLSDSFYSEEKIKMFLDEYLQIHYIVRNTIEKNIILDLSDRLSALELIKTFPEDNSQNPILRLLLGSAEGKNELIKNSRLYQDVVNKEQLEKNRKIRTIEMIAQNANNSDLKLSRYFAIVNADGDRMGKTLETLKNEEINGFSKKLFCHASNAAEKIKDFGGMTIYAGGDDLLFLAPVLGNDGKSIFTLCDTLRTDFADMMKDENGEGPTLSFGIAIQYYKYPLYEAMEISREMLAESKKGNKNATAMNLQKHSGQSLCLKIANENLDKVEQLLQTVNVTENDEQTLHSMIYSIEEFKGLYDQMIRNAVLDWEECHDEIQGQERFAEIWLHLFDNSSQEKYMNYIKAIATFFYQECIVEKRILAEDLSMDRKDAGDITSVIASLLRLKKFFKEKGGEKE